jgi:hypothetical protein
MMNDTLGIFLTYLLTIGYFVGSYYTTVLIMNRLKDSDEEFLKENQKIPEQNRMAS